MFGSNREVSITIGEDAKLDATGIYLIAQAEDRSLAEYLGAPQRGRQLRHQPARRAWSQGSDRAAGEGARQELDRDDHDRNGAQLIGDDTVGIYATAGADASGSGRGSLFSIGFAQATATATVDIQTGVVITSTAAIVITSTARARPHR